MRSSRLATALVTMAMGWGMAACKAPLYHPDSTPPEDYRRHFPDRGGDDPASAIEPDELSDPLGLADYKSPQTRPGQREDLLFIVTISGGGHRSANLGVGALVELERMDLLDEVDYVSTVSGGGFAAGLLVRYRHEQAEAAKTGESRPELQSFAAFVEHNKRAVERSYVGGLVKVIFGCGVGGVVTLGALAGILCPRQWGLGDVGDELEELIDRKLFGADKVRREGKRFKCVMRRRENPPEGSADPDNCALPVSSSLNLDAMFVPRDRPAEMTEGMPLWIANSTNRANGARVPMTPGVISRAGALIFRHHQLLTASRDEGLDIPLALALRASAGFPAYPTLTMTDGGCGRWRATKHKVPKGRICTDEGYSHMHLVDGGISDNLGLLTAGEIIDHEWTGAHRPAITVVLTIDAFNASQSGWSDRESSNSGNSAWKLANAYMAHWRHLTYVSFRDRARREPGLTWIPLGFESLCDDASRPRCRWLPQADGPDDGARRKARGTKTNFDVSRSNQRALINYGKSLVSTYADPIRDAVEGNSELYPREATSGSGLLRKPSSARSARVAGPN